LKPKTKKTLSLFGFSGKGIPTKVRKQKKKLLNLNQTFSSKFGLLVFWLCDFFWFAVQNESKTLRKTKKHLLRPNPTSSKCF